MLHAGASLGGDCVPAAANYERFYGAAPSVAWEVVVANAGHFQFLDSQTLLQQAVCAQVQVTRIFQVTTFLPLLQMSYRQLSQMQNNMRG
jgi:hypothetical protein